MTEFHSQNGVDQEVAQYLPEIGYACEVGANDGLLFSNTLYFERLGWTVLCVEPNTELEASGREHRKLWRQVACADFDGEHDFTYYQPWPYGASSSLEIRPGYETHMKGTSLVVPVRRLDRVLEEAGFPRLDYLAIDVEGWEREVLKGFTAERWSPRVIVVETVGYTLPPPAGYRLVQRMEFDDVFVREDVLAKEEPE